MITQEMFVKEVRRLVTENPDFVYQQPNPNERCSYLKHKPCLFGQVLSNLGVTQEELLKCETNDIAKVLRAILVDKFETPLTFAVRDWANAIQYRQDNNYSWKNALKAGDSEYPEIKNIQ